MKSPKRRPVAPEHAARHTVQAPAVPRDMGLRNTWPAFWPGALLALALLLPFLGKAHALDDVTFLLQAEHIRTDPLHPTAFDLVSDGKAIRLSGSLASGPVAAYLLVPCVMLGGAEWAARLLHLALVLLGLLATVGIALRLGFSRAAARSSGLLLAATPAVIAMATTSMADIPAMAFGVIGVERMLAWRDDARVSQGLCAAIALALAVLSRAHLLLLLPIAALAASGGVSAQAMGRLRWRAWAPTVLALGIVLAVTAISADPAGAHGDLVSATHARMQLERTRPKLAAFLAHWVLTLPLALPWLWVRGPAMLRDLRLYGVAMVTALVLGLGAHPAMPLTLLPLGVLGGVVLADIGLDALARRDALQGWLGAWLLLACATLVYVHVPAKYLVPSAPAVALLVARLLHPAHARPHRMAAGFTLALGSVLGVLIALADAEFTDVGRRAARELIAPRVEAGERVWYSGSWGSQWYAMKAGATMLTNDVRYLHSGDIIVSSRYTGGLQMDSSTGVERVGGLHANSRFGRIMDPAAGSGFYSNWFGYLPWSWRNGEIEAVTVWRVH